MSFFVEPSEEDESDESGKDWDDLEEEARQGKWNVTLHHPMHV